MISFRHFSLQGQTVYFRICKGIPHQGRAIFFLLFCSLDNFRQFFRQHLNLLKYLSLDLRDIHTTNYAPIQCTVWSRNSFKCPTCLRTAPVPLRQRRVSPWPVSAYLPVGFPTIRCCRHTGWRRFWTEIIISVNTCSKKNKHLLSGMTNNTLIL